MMALLLIPRGLAFGGDWENFRRRIRMFRNHPALLAWDEEEGLARGDMSMAALVKMRQIIKEEDPHHPFMVGDSRDVINKVKDRSELLPAGAHGSGMWWWYPIPPGGAQGDALAGEELTKAASARPAQFPHPGENRQSRSWVGSSVVQEAEKLRPILHVERIPRPGLHRGHPRRQGLMWYGGSVRRRHLPGPQGRQLGLPQDPRPRAARDVAGVHGSVARSAETDARRCAGERDDQEGRRAAGAYGRESRLQRCDGDDRVRRISKPKLRKSYIEGRSAKVEGGALKETFKPYQTTSSNGP
jgi:hypothetical protein